MSAHHPLSLSVQYSDPSLRESLPRSTLRRWVQAALTAPAQLTLRFVDAEEGRALNNAYRGKDYATNVLTFAYDTRADGGTHADIVLCCPVLRQEALQQGKPVRMHAAHLVIHGVLHAQGHDHETDAEAAIMEARETALLAGLGFPDPYAAG